jgi:integrase
VVPRAGFEPATTVFKVENDLEEFGLFAVAKLNLSKLTASQYICKLRAFLKDRTAVTDRDVQTYIQAKKECCSAGYVSNVISAFKAYFRDFKGLSFMNGYRHPPEPLRMKEEIEPGNVKTFIEAIDNLTVKTAALFLASSGLRKNEVLSLAWKDIDRNTRAIVPGCHSGETKHSGISFYNSEAEAILVEFERSASSLGKDGKLFHIGHETFLRAWNQARKKTGLNLKPKDLRDFFSQEMGKSLIPDRYVDIFQGRAPRNILAKHYTPKGIKLLREIYDKACLRVLA